MATLETSPRHARPNNSSHSHSHHHDNSYLVSQNGNEDGVKITRIGLYVNLGMAIGKGIGGYAFNSQGEYDMRLYFYSGRPSADIFASAYR